jgi:hypothetical protein
MKEYPRNKPFIQAPLDGKCGFFAVINALLALGCFDRDPFKLARKELIQLYYEIDQGLMPDIPSQSFIYTKEDYDIDGLLESACSRHPINYSLPFLYKFRRVNASGFAKKLKEILKNPDSLAIIAYTRYNIRGLKLWDHYSAVIMIEDDNSLRLFDSCGICRLKDWTINTEDVNAAYVIEYQYTYIVKRK